MNIFAMLQRHLGSLSTASLAYFHNIPLALRANIPDISAKSERNIVKVFCANLCSMNLGGAVANLTGPFLRNGISARQYG